MRPCMRTGPCAECLCIVSESRHVINCRRKWFMQWPEMCKWL